MQKNYSPWEDRLFGPRTRRNALVSKATYRPNREIVVRMVSSQKTQRGVRSVVSYIGQHGGEKDQGLFRHDGTEIKPGEIEKLIDDWDLTPDKDNYSKAYREASDEDRAKLSDNERYYSRQSSHFIVSIPERHARISDDQMHGIAQGFMEPFVQEGHQCVYAIHRHQKMPHIHIVMTSEGLDTRLQLKQGHIQKLREHTKAVAGKHGIEVEATRRINRKSLRERMEAHEKHREQLERLAYLRSLEDTLKKEREHESRIPVSNAITRLEREMGREIKEEPLRPKNDYFTAKVRDHSVPLLKRQAPVWYERHGTRAQAALLGRPLEELGLDTGESQEVELPALGQKTNTALQGFLEKRFEEPDTVRGVFLEMAAENTRTAFWYANNRPEVFGKTTDDDTARLSQRDVRLSKDWQEKAYKRLWTLPDAGDLTREVMTYTNGVLENMRSDRAKTLQYERDIKYLREHRRLPPAPERPPPERGFVGTLVDRAKGLFTSEKAAHEPQQEKEKEAPVSTPAKERDATPVPKKAQERPAPSPVPSPEPEKAATPTVAPDKPRKKKPRSRGKDQGREIERER